MKMILFLLLIIGLPILSFSQGEIKKVKLGDEFSLQENQTVFIEDANLEMQIVEVGHKKTLEGGKSVIQIQLKRNEVTDKITAISQMPFQFGEYEIIVWNSNPFADGYGTFAVKQKKAQSIKNAKTKKANIGQKFTLNKGDSVVFNNSNLGFTFNSLVYEILRSTDGQEIQYYRLNIDVSDFNIKGIVDDNEFKLLGFVIYCEPPLDKLPVTFVVKNAPKSKDEVAQRFVERFGWNIDETVPPAVVSMDLPRQFTGLPFYHYQSASLRSGVDMTRVAGKTIEMRQYKLKAKGKTRVQKITNFAHLIIENGKVVGAWRTDSSASAPGIYSFEVRKK